MNAETLICLLAYGRKIKLHRVTRVYQGVRNYTPIEINQSWSYVVLYIFYAYPRSDIIAGRPL